MSAENNPDQVIRILKEKISLLQAPSLLKQWQFKLVDPNPGVAVSGRDGWETVSVPHSWSSKDGEGWFKTNPALPSIVENIQLASSRIEFEFLLPIGAGILLNGQEIFREPSWTDTRAVRLEIIKHFEPGIPLELEVRCNAQDGLAQFQNSSLVVSGLSEVIFKLDMVLAQTRFCQFMAAENPGRHAEYEKSLQLALKSLDINALSTNHWDNFWRSVDAFNEGLSPFEQEAKTYISHLVAHSHIDMNWLWPQAETIDVCRRDFSAMLSLMDRYPEFHFSQSQTATYQFMESEFPAIFDRVKAQVEAGRWDVTASTWVEGDLNLASGETLARQFLHAIRFSQNHFNKAPLICWEPDTFGHPATLPQLLQKSGVEYYYSCRGGKDYPLFVWEGMDGTRIFAVQDPTWYMGTVTPSSVVNSVIKFASSSMTHHGLLVYGVGDHGGGGTSSDIEAARLIDAAPFMPRVISESTIPFFEQSKAEAVNLPVVKGELNTVFEGCYTSHGDIKRLNRLCENQLLSAESAAAISALVSGNRSNSLANDWQTLCFHQFHDILGGCAISVTYREARQKLEQVAKNAQTALDQALHTIVNSTDSPVEKQTINDKEPHLVVFNPLGWQRPGVVRFSIDPYCGKIPSVMADSEGRFFPVQESGSEIVFIADELPALGLQAFKPIYNQFTKEDSVVRIDPETQVIDNGILKLHICPENGEIDYLEDLHANRILLDYPGSSISKGQETFLNRLEIYWEKPHGMSAWMIGEISHVDVLPANALTEVLENGPVRAVIETRRHFLNSEIKQRIVLYRKSPVIHFETEIDWREHGSYHTGSPMLRVAFAPLLQETRATFEIPFAGVQREANGHEVPALRWADLSENGGSYGLSLLNDGKYGHQAEGSVLRLTLLRASYEPDLNPDEGRHSFTYSIYPHPGSWQTAGTIQKSAELNQPVQSILAPQIDKSFQPGNPWLECESNSVLISACKLAEDQPEGIKSIIVRLYESHGKSNAAFLKVNFPFFAIYETDLIEQPISPIQVEDNGVKMDFAPFEIKTLKIQF